VLLVVLHDNQAPNAEDVATSQLDRPPLDLHTHGAGVVIDLGNVAQDLSVDFGADSLCEMLRELWVLDLTRECLLHAESCAFVEFCKMISERNL
jgi:hypothetical protein